MCFAFERAPSRLVAALRPESAGKPRRLSGERCSSALRLRPPSPDAAQLCSSQHGLPASGQPPRARRRRPRRQRGPLRHLRGRRHPLRGGPLDGARPLRGLRRAALRSPARRRQCHVPRDGARRRRRRGGPGRLLRRVGLRRVQDLRPVAAGQRPRAGARRRLRPYPRRAGQRDAREAHARRPQRLLALLRGRHGLPQRRHVRRRRRRRARDHLHGRERAPRRVRREARVCERESPLEKVSQSPGATTTTSAASTTATPRRTTTTRARARWRPSTSGTRTGA